MRIQDSRRFERAIEGALRSVRAGSFSSEHLSWLAQLMIFWAYGYLEASCREAVLEYTSARSSASVVNYVDHQLKYFRNPRTHEIIALVRLFDGGAASKLQNFAQGSVGSSIDSIVATRHSLAHGRDAQVTVHTFRRYYDDARLFTKKMRSLMESRN